jgi:hypothetical protein
MLLPSHYAKYSCEPYSAMVLDFCVLKDVFRESP